MKLWRKFAQQAFTRLVPSLMDLFLLFITVWVNHLFSPQKQQLVVSQTLHLNVSGWTETVGSRWKKTASQRRIMLRTLSVPLLPLLSLSPIRWLVEKLERGESAGKKQWLLLLFFLRLFIFHECRIFSFSGNAASVIQREQVFHCPSNLRQQ